MDRGPPLPQPGHPQTVSDHQQASGWPTRHAPDTDPLTPTTKDHYTTTKDLTSVGSRSCRTRRMVDSDGRACLGCVVFLGLGEYFFP